MFVLNFVKKVVSFVRNYLRNFLRIYFGKLYICSRKKNPPLPQNGSRWVLEFLKEIIS